MERNLQITFIELRFTTKYLHKLPTFILHQSNNFIVLKNKGWKSIFAKVTNDTLLPPCAYVVLGCYFWSTMEIMQKRICRAYRGRDGKIISQLLQNTLLLRFYYTISLIVISCGVWICCGNRWVWFSFSRNINTKVIPPNFNSLLTLISRPTEEINLENCQKTKQ